MAKKSPTPAPPRKVQAPQRRSAPRRTQRLPRGGNLMLVVVAATGVLAAVAAAVLLVTRSGDDGAAAPNVPASNKLIGLQTGAAPWNQGLDTLPDRLDALGLHPLTTEGEVLHIHQHLDIFVNGKPEPVPTGIGIYDGQFLTELHTHDASGILHVESPTAGRFTLGQFFGVWGVRLTADCVGGYCRPLTPWSFYVDGQRYDGNPAELVLKSHQEIVFAIGTPPKTIPSSYKFAAGT